jgi:hypothetical protein
MLTKTNVEGSLNEKRRVEHNKTVFVNEKRRVTRKRWYSEGLKR